MTDVKNWMDYKHLMLNDSKTVSHSREEERFAETDTHTLKVLGNEFEIHKESGRYFRPKFVIQ